jgi:hypothetical protein
MYSGVIAAYNGARGGGQSSTTLAPPRMESSTNIRPSLLQLAFWAQMTFFSRPLEHQQACPRKHSRHALKNRRAPWGFVTVFLACPCCHSTSAFCVQCPCYPCHPLGPATRTSHIRATRSYLRLLARTAAKRESIDWRYPCCPCYPCCHFIPMVRLPVLSVRIAHCICSPPPSPRRCQWYPPPTGPDKREKNTGTDTSPNSAPTHSVSIALNQAKWPDLGYPLGFN